MSEAAKNRAAAIAVCVAAIALAAALAAQWLPNRSILTVQPGRTVAYVQTAATTAQTNTHAEYINVNTATLDELLTLPHISLEIATSIMAYRHNYLAFSSWEDLLAIDGVTEEIVAVWKAYAILA